MTVIRIVLDYKEALTQGLLVTLTLSAVVWCAGISLGILSGTYAHKQKDAGHILKALSFLLSSIPILVLLFWLHYPLQEMLGVVLYPFFTAAFALSLINIVLIAQIVRDVLDEFPSEYITAGKVCGLTGREILIKIQFPIIFRQLIPQLLSIQVQMLQMTLFASLISVEELFRVAQQINSMIYKPIEVYTALAFFFIAICLPLNLLSSHLKGRYTRNLSEK